MLCRSSPDMECTRTLPSGGGRRGAGGKRGADETYTVRKYSLETDR